MERVPVRDAGDRGSIPLGRASYFISDPMEAAAVHTEIVRMTDGFVIGDAPSVELLQIRVNDTVYFIHTIYRWQTNPIDQVIFLSYWRNSTEIQFTHIPYNDDTFAWAEREMHEERTTELFVLINGERQVVEVGQLLETDTATMVGPVWCPVANIVRERASGPGGREIRRGSKHFAPGAKLYCYPALWGDGYEQIQVIGRHRATHRYVKMIVNEKWLTNWRVQLAYSPHVIRELWPAWDGTERSRERAQEIVDFMTVRVKERAGLASSGDDE